MISFFFSYRFNVLLVRRLSKKKVFSECVCSEEIGDLQFFCYFQFFAQKGFCSANFGLLPLGNYKFKFIQPSGVEVTQLLETAKACGLNLAETKMSNPSGYGK